MTTPVSNINRTNLNALDPNLATGQVADPALRKACFDEIYNYFDTFVTSYNAFISGGIATANIADFAITTAKLALLSVTAAQIANGTITTTQIADGTILDADINNAAAIAWTKISKASSSLADLTTRSAADLNSGTLSAAQMPALTGDITTLVGTIAATLKNTGTAGTYKSVTTDAQGRVIAGTNPTTLAGYGITDVSSGAEVNQNTFAIISVAGQSDVVADQKSDALTLVNGTGITITTNPATDAITITATGAALPGAHASTHITGGTDVIANAVAGGNAGLMSGADKTQVNLIAPHLADYTEHVPYGGATTGSANTYALATPTIASLTTGMAVSVKFNVDSTAASTLNWNGTGAKGIKKSNGSDVTNLKATGIYTLRYDGTNFILQGEGGSGNATASNLLSGKTASVDVGDIVGTMPNNSGLNINALSSDIATVGRLGFRPQTAGYFDTTSEVSYTDANFIAANIPASVSMFGLVGTGANAKAYASGTTTSSTTQIAFTTESGTTPNSYYLTVSGLVMPNGIGIIKLNYPSAPLLVIYSNNLIHVNSKILHNNGGTITEYRLTGNAFVTTSGFQLPILGNGLSVPWEAWGL